QLAETRLQAPLLEIYGSTETGQIATRRTAQTDLWELLPDLRLEPEAQGHVRVCGAHLAQAQVLHDVIEIVDQRRFRLHGRSADMVNIAGKRSSLAHLNHQLASIPGVRDGAFFMPDAETDDSVTRLMAFVVAPGLDHDLVRAALRERIDPVFMPRPLVLVDALPRNATGKLPRSALHALAMRAPLPQIHDSSPHAD
ncbi:MAG: AMP-binding enzyme, partial [Thiomonas delicata]